MLQIFNVLICNVLITMIIVHGFPLCKSLHWKILALSKTSEDNPFHQLQCSLLRSPHCRWVTAFMNLYCHQDNRWQISKPLVNPSFDKSPLLTVKIPFHKFFTNKYLCWATSLFINIPLTFPHWWPPLTNLSNHKQPAAIYHLLMDLYIIT